ncbi:MULTISPECIES: ribonuclease R [Deinococcus]|uniref:Ribonuclease R n=1 Tax=Deinococcus rufus TaxID=2136097 RepID=A0ABV7Z274_9DEIO|nr:ribonuclease R [Deinococcus sp. AB2017081]WQE95765.1 ribonuclease R [Deinococcus sp. AB2017081]
MPKKKQDTVPEAKPRTTSKKTTKPITPTSAASSEAAEPAAPTPARATGRASAKAAPSTAKTPARKKTAAPAADTTETSTPTPEAVTPTRPRTPRAAKAATPTVPAPAPARPSRKKTAAPVASVEAVPVEPAPVEPVPAETLPEAEPAPRTATVTPEPTPRKGRSRKTPPAPEPAEAALVADVPVTPEVTPVSAADSSPRRGRGKRPAQPAAEHSVREHPAPEQTVTAQPVTGPSAPDAADLAATEPAEAPVTPVRRGRKARTTMPAPAEATPVEAAAPDAEQVTPPPADEPLILEVPKRRGRGKRALTDAPLTEVLGGVEAVPTAAPTGAAQGVAHAHVRPLVDMPGDDGEESAPPVPAKRKGRPERPAAPETVATPDTDPAQELVLAQLRKLGRPLHVKDLERTFTRQMLDRIGDWRDLERMLDELTEDGQVIRTRKKTYGLPEAMSLVRGKFQASAAGFGFVVPDSGGDDFYIPAEQTLEAWNGDVVLVRMEGRGDTGNRGGPRRGQRGDGSPRASVVRIVQRAYSQLVGTLEFHHGHPILKPDDHRARHRILVLPDGLEGLEAGARVVTELYWPENTGEDEVFGQVVRVLGAEDDPVTETEAVIVKFGLRGAFPPEVEAQAGAIAAAIPEEALKGRLDLRGFNIFTVDGRDAKDFDDAIHIQPTPEGTFVVGVHIADVSHYVTEGSPLDEEAYARATSVYLPGRVLPMLPEHLSNGVCSLVPYEDRLTMTALVELSAEGEILKVQIAPSVINSKARLTYDEVQAYSEATATLPDAARMLEGDLHLLLKITTKLRQKRLREGSLDFKMREVKVDVGPDGRMELIPIREETARGMIEDLMLLANKVVARYLLERSVPALFRIHEEPTLQRFQDVTNAIGRLGFSFPGGQPTPQAYQAVLKQVRGTPRESVVNTLLLRSMQQAKYAGENLGHFGLAFEEYLHFTSPIRRYPDLLVHRVLRGVLSGELRAGTRAVADLQARLPGMGDHTSARERTAAEAERDLTKYYQAKWAQEHLGESFPGTVSGVTASGLYVALDNGVEGKLHISHLDDDYYVYLEDSQILRGRSRGRTYRLGDSVNVTIQAVKPLARQTDLTLADPTDPAYRPGTMPEENSMDSPVKVRARRREDREQEKQKRLETVPVSEPRKFTLDDPEPARGALAPARTGGRERGSGRPTRGAQTQPQSGSPGGRQRTFGGVPMEGGGRQGGSGGGRGTRRVVTLERPRNEHLRPVNITVQRMYFGDWTLDNMPPEDPQGGGGRTGGGRPGGTMERGRGYTRGGNDRGAHERGAGSRGGGSGRSGGQAQPAAPRAQASSAPAPAQATSGDEGGKRRRRRRGRRSGSGGGES